jgi:hypothetical protein
VFSSTFSQRLVPIAVLISVILTGCQGNLDGVSVTAETPDGPADVLLRDGRRVPAEEELLVSSSDEEAHEVTFREDLAVAGEVSVLELVVTGDPREAALGFRLNDRREMVSLGDIFRIDDAGWAGFGGGTTRILLQIPRWFINDGVISKGAALTFRGADPENLTGTDPSSDRRFQVQALAFRPVPSTVRVGLDSEVRFDYRLPVESAKGAWTLHTASLPTQSHTDAFRLEYDYPREAFRDRSDRPTALIEIAATPVRWNLRPGRSSTVLRPSLWHDGQRADTIAITPSPYAEDFLFRNVLFPAAPEHPHEPIPVELTEMSRYPRSAWRNDEYELFSWSLYPDILWVDTRDYRVQSAFFKRLAFFVEKRGFIGTLLTDQELEGRHGYNAHNYRPEGLAAFFNAVDEQDFPINRYETLLRDISADRGIIEKSPEGRWTPGRGGVLGVSRESFGELRRLLVIHEGMHGIIYEVDEFHRGVAQYWRTNLTERERRYWQDMFAWMNYTPDDEYLMYNEFQAYLLQQSERGVPWYFRSRMADRVRNSAGRYEPVDTFLRDHPTTFEDAAAAINALLFRTTGMVGGDPFCLVPVEE